MMQREVFIFSSGPMVLANRAIDAQYGGNNLETPDRDLDPANTRSMHLVPTLLLETFSVLIHRVPYASEVVGVTRDRGEERSLHVSMCCHMCTAGTFWEAGPKSHHLVSVAGRDVI